MDSAVHDIKIVQGDERLLLLCQAEKMIAVVFRDIVHPITPEARQQIESEI